MFFYETKSELEIRDFSFSGLFSEERNDMQALV